MNFPKLGCLYWPGEYTLLSVVLGEGLWRIHGLVATEAAAVKLMESV